MFRKSSRDRKKSFLLDSNINARKQPKKLRNTFLNVVVRILFVRQVVRFFQARFIFTFILLAMTGFIGFSVLSPYFDLKQISVVRDNPNIDVEKIEHTLEGFYGQNLLFMDISGMKETLRQSFPEFRGIETREIWPDTIEIKVQISPALFTIFNQETANFSVISEDGVILAEKPSEDLRVLKIFDYEKSLVAGQKFTDKPTLDFIQLAIEELTNINLPVEEVRHFPTARESHFILENLGTEIWIDHQLNLQQQIKKLSLGADKMGLYTQPLNHIDLRIPSNIFWE